MDHKEFMEKIYKRAEKLNSDIDKTTAGSKERNLAVSDLANVVEKLNTFAEKEVEREDKEAKRAEQERVNEVELTIKKAQLVNETNRLNMDMESRKNQIKADFSRIGLDFLANITRVALWGRFTSVAMNEEYNLNGSRSIPIGVQRRIDSTPPKKL